MYAISVEIKICKFWPNSYLTDFSKISPETSNETAKYQIWEREQMEDREISQIAKTSSTFGAKCARKLWNFIVFTLWSHDMLFLKIDLIDKLVS